MSTIKRYPLPKESEKLLYSRLYEPNTKGKIIYVILDEPNRTMVIVRKDGAYTSEDTKFLENIVYELELFIVQSNVEKAIEDGAVKYYVLQDEDEKYKKVTIDTSSYLFDETQTYDDEDIIVEYESPETPYFNTYHSIEYIVNKDGKPIEYKNQTISIKNQYISPLKPHDITVSINGTISDEMGGLTRGIINLVKPTEYPR